jgi:hypothetical protein
MTKHRNVRRRRAYRYFRYLCALDDGRVWRDLNRDDRVEYFGVIVPWSVIRYLP